MKNILKLTIGVLISIQIVLGQEIQDPINEQGSHENRCMINAIIYKASLDLDKVCVWSRVISIGYTYNGKQYRHAMCVFEYPKGSGHGYAYDLRGSQGICLKQDVKTASPYDIADNLSIGVGGRTEDAYWLDNDDPQRLVADSAIQIDNTVNNSVMGSTMP